MKNRVYTALYEKIVVVTGVRAEENVLVNRTEFTKHLGQAFRSCFKRQLTDKQTARVRALSLFTTRQKKKLMEVMEQPDAAIQQIQCS